MAKDIPVRQNNPGHYVNPIANVILSFRISKKMTQKNLSLKIGSYVTKKGTNIISDYERGFSIPDLKHIYNLSLVLDIEFNTLFNMAMREHFKRFTESHQSIYTDYMKKGIYREGRYYFHTVGKIKYRFPKFISIIKENMIQRGINKIILIEEIKSSNKFSVRYLSDILGNRQTPSLKIVIALASYFKLDSFKIYKTVIEEKGISHAKNMMKQWDKYKEMRKHEAENSKIRESFGDKMVEFV